MDSCNFKTKLIFQYHSNGIDCVYFCRAYQSTVHYQVSLYYQYNNNNNQVWSKTLIYNLLYKEDFTEYFHSYDLKTSIIDLSISPLPIADYIIANIKAINPLAFIKSSTKEPTNTIVEKYSDAYAINYSINGLFLLISGMEIPTFLDALDFSGDNILMTFSQIFYIISILGSISQSFISIILLMASETLSIP